MISVVLTGAILVAAYSTFQTIVQAHLLFTSTVSNQGKLYFISEKIATIIKDGGTIDYEEYFNRRALGYER